MDNFINNDEATFDRLVDGELSVTERQQLLASLDAQEDGWRRCALAFLESQAWGGEFKRIVNEPATATSVSLDRASASERRERRTSGNWLAVAAGLLLAFGIGWLANQSAFNDSKDQPPTLANVERVESPLHNDPIADNIDPDDAVTLLVRDVSGNDQRVQVPLVEVESLDNQFANALPANLRERFRSRGFDVERRRRFAPMFFEQNEQLVPMVVPVDDTRIVPVNRPIY